MKKENSYSHILKYTGLLGGVQVLHILISVIRNKVTALFIGSAGMGWSDLFARTIELMASATNFGIGFSAIRRLSVLYETGDTTRTGRYVRLVRSWVLLTGLFGMGVTLLLSPLLSLFATGGIDRTFQFALLSPAILLATLLGGEIAEDLAAYFVESEQIPTACALGVLVGLDQSVTAAGGYIIQLLPGRRGYDRKIEAGVHAMGSVSSALAGVLDGEGLLRAVLKDFDLEILEKHPVEYRCYCSRERVSRALISMGVAELEDLLAEQGGCELGCQFCDKVYRFTGEELQGLIDQMKAQKKGENRDV